MLFDLRCQDIEIPATNHLGLASNNIGESMDPKYHQERDQLADCLTRPQKSRRWGSAAGKPALEACVPTHEIWS